jgi:hypothetical protein
MSFDESQIKMALRIEKLTEQRAKALAFSYRESLDYVNKELLRLYEKAQTGKMTYALANQYNRLGKLKLQIIDEIKSMYSTNRKEITDIFSEVYEEGYLNSGYLINKEFLQRYNAELDYTFSRLNRNVILSAIENPITELRLSPLLEAHRASLVNKLNTGIAQGLIQGIGYEKVARNLKDIMQSDFNNNIMRIVRTESHRLLEKARSDNYEELVNETGLRIDYKMWISTLDGVTRDAHQAMDGRKVEREKNFNSPAGGSGPYPGNMNNAADDINCRCTHIILMNEKQPETRRIGAKTVKFATYEEWKSSLPKA